MGYPDYKRDLLAADFDATRVLYRYFHSRPSAVFQGAPPEEEPDFKWDLARRLHDALGVPLHPLELVVCGSAHLGFSPVPNKLGKSFDPSSSDIDIAIVSPELFDRCWHELQSNPPVREIRERIAEELFWGFINPANVYKTSKVVSRWWDVFGNMRTDRAHGVRGRLYRDYWSMQAYHTLAINRGRDALTNKLA
jgi:hypothetical protein